MPFEESQILSLGNLFFHSLIKFYHQIQIIHFIQSERVTVPQECSPRYFSFLNFCFILLFDKKKVSHHNLSLHMCLGITINAWWQCRSQLLMTVPKLFIYPNIWQLHTLYILVIWINMHFIFSDHILSEWKFYEIYLCNRVSTGPANCRCSIKMATLQYFTNQAVL